MPGFLRSDLRCPECGKDVSATFKAHDSESQTTTVEYLHLDDSSCERVYPSEEVHKLEQTGDA